MIKFVGRGEIYLANLNLTLGSEQGGVRYILIIQNNSGNYYSHTTITSKEKNKLRLPTHLLIRSRDNLTNDSVVLFEQIRTIDKSRLIRKLDELKHSEIMKMNKCMLISLDLEY